MTRPLRLLRAALAVIGGLLLAGALAAPAAAAPSAFEASDTGEDLCTYYDTKGEADWIAGPDEPQAPHVQIEGYGRLSYAEPGTICLGVVPSDREIEFTAYVEERPVDVHTEPFNRPDSGQGPDIEFTYEFPLSGPGDAPIEYITVAICKVEDLGWGDRCTEPVFVAPGAETS